MLVLKKSKKTISVLGVMLCLILTGFAHAAYVPPIGIPAPTFGINEVAPVQPAQWPNAQVPSYYYIDNTHPAATDINNPNGYPAKLRKTLPAGAFSSGSYVEVNGGPYTTTLLVIFNCTAVAPCWLRGSSNTSKTVITSARIGI